MYILLIFLNMTQYYLNIYNWSYIIIKEKLTKHIKETILN